MIPAALRSRNGRREILIAATFALALSLLVSFAPPPSANVLNGALHDFAHVVVFAAMGFALARAGLRRLTPRSTAMLALVALTGGLALGIVTEAIQAALGGWFSRGDVVRDTAGFVAGAALVQLRQRTRPLLRRLIFAVLAASGILALLPLASAGNAYLARHRAFPTLADPSIPATLRFVHNMGRRPQLLEIPPRWAAQPGERAIELFLAGGRWPGLSLGEPLADWRGWRALSIEVVNPAPEPIELGVRVDDEGSSGGSYFQRYNGSRRVPAASRVTLEIPIREIEAGPVGRRLDLARIHYAVIFHDGELHERRLFVRRIQLVR